MMRIHLPLHFETKRRQSSRTQCAAQLAVAFCVGAIVLLVGGRAMARGAEAGPIAGVPWPATDGLGRSLPTPEEAGLPHKDRFVGIFYFLWLNEIHNKSPHYPGPHDVAKILAMDPDAMKKPTSPLWGPLGTSHYWGEPLYGYYLITDPWVLRRHAHMLADAGIDALIIDATNALTYNEQYTKLCEVHDQMRQDGERPPQIAFMVNTEAGKTAMRLYNEFYKPGLHKACWFQWRDKPLMICDPNEAAPEMQRFFTLRKAHWPFQMVNTQNAWHWEATYPQPYGFTDDPKKAEQVNVSVAQNLRASDGQVTNMSDGVARGRSFHNGKQDISPGSVDRGYNFQEQWKRAFELTPPFVMVTGWNEWIAGRWGNRTTHFFVDQYNQEYSRDIEPMKDGHGDNYYWQLVANIRRYKGSTPLPRPSGPATIRMASGFEQWRDVQPEYLDHAGETLPRSFDGAGGLKYANRTGRNDIVAAKIARDSEQVWFYVRTRKPLTVSTGNAWMWLLIDTDQNTKTGWEGYDFIVNRLVDGKSHTWLEKNAGGWKWEKVARSSYHVAGDELQVAVPRSALGLQQGATGLSIDFKWADNIQRPGDIMDFYISGDVAPDARFMYRYVAP